MGFDEAGHKGLRNVIKKSDMKLVLEDNQSDKHSRRTGAEEGGTVDHICLV